MSAFLLRDAAVAIAISIAAFLILAFCKPPLPPTFVVFNRNHKKSASRDTVLICGPSASGKTTLFLRLLERTKDTLSSRVCLTSKQINEFLFPLEEHGCSLSVVDVPGAARFSRKIPSLLERARTVLFVIDAKESGSATAASMFCRDILASDSFSDARVCVIANSFDRKESPEDATGSLARFEEQSTRSITEKRSHVDDEHSEEQQLLRQSKLASLLDGDNCFHISSLPNVSFHTGSLVDEDFVGELRGIAFPAP